MHRILLSSDIHLCHVDWYGVSPEERLSRWVRDLRAEYARAPFDALLLLGDYSLDHWAWKIKGSYLERGVSYAERFARDYLSAISELGVEIRMIAGNHEQYGDETFRALTGHDRHSSLRIGDFLFILTDTFRGELDPTYHHDGVYTGIEVDFVRTEMQKHPDARVILCAHWLDASRESEEARALVADKRIVCLFAGHNHRAHIGDFDGKPLLYTGHYSYGAPEGTWPISAMWGYRELLLGENSLVSRYLTPENELAWEGERILCKSGTQDALTLSF
jgi:calcineurin-like phosphoesterase family protein